MNKQYNSEKGFSLIELIGVVAIIAILGALVAPRVLTSIDDAKIAAVVQDVQRLRTVVARFYKDTSQLPAHYPDSTNPSLHQLISQGAVRGWKGPYLEEELLCPLSNVTNYSITSTQVTFDVDGDGNTDFTTATILLLQGLTQKQAIAISDAIDGDADKIGAAAWYAGGKVRTSNSSATDPTLYIMLVGRR